MVSSSNIIFRHPNLIRLRSRHPGDELTHTKSDYADTPVNNLEKQTSDLPMSKSTMRKWVAGPGVSHAMEMISDKPFESRCELGEYLCKLFRCMLMHIVLGVNPDSLGSGHPVKEPPRPLLTDVAAAAVDEQ